MYYDILYISVYLTLHTETKQNKKDLYDRKIASLK